MVVRIGMRPTQRLSISNSLLTAGIDASPILLNPSPVADPCNLTVSLSAELDTQEQRHQATPLMCSTI